MASDIRPEIPPDAESDIDVDTPGHRAGWWALIDELPYAAIIVLTLIGIAYEDLSSESTALYWAYVTPAVALICIGAGWRHAPPSARNSMVVIQVLQWVAVLVAMWLVVETQPRQSLLAIATGLTLLTMMGLGVFISGLNLRSWKLCLTGAFLAVCVPILAWVQRSFVLLLLIGAGVIGILILYWYIRQRRRDAEI